MEIHKEKRNWMAAIIMIIIIIIILQQNGAHPGKAMAMQCMKTDLFCIQHMHFSYYIFRIHIFAIATLSFATRHVPARTPQCYANTGSEKKLNYWWLCCYCCYHYIAMACNQMKNETKRNEMNDGVIKKL